jgi:hypothetical protein
MDYDILFNEKLIKEGINQSNIIHPNTICDLPPGGTLEGLVNSLAGFFVKFGF